MKLKVFAVLVAILLASGCASVTRGTTDVLQVNTNPPQADVEVYRTNNSFTRKELNKNLGKAEASKIIEETPAFDGPIRGKSPVAFTLARKGEYILKISKPGYKAVEVKITNKISGAGSAGMAGNVLVGGFIGAGIDAGTGAMKNLVPNPVEINLESE